MAQGTHLAREDADGPSNPRRLSAPCKDAGAASNVRTAGASSGRAFQITVCSGAWFR
jgi:hypothetical protein